MTLEFPHWFVPRGQWRKNGISRSGGRSISGSEQVVSSSSGFWSLSTTFGLRGENHTLAWNAFYAAVDGGATEFLVPCIFRYRPHNAHGYRLAGASVASLEPGSIHELAGFEADEPELIFVDAEAAVGSTRLRLHHPGVPGIRPGQYFGIGERLYLVSNTWQLNHERSVSSGGALTYNGEVLTYDGNALSYGGSASTRIGRNTSVIEFWPKLREGVAFGVALKLGRPVCRMRLASDDTGVLEQPIGISGSVSLDLVEAI